MAAILLPLMGGLAQAQSGTETEMTEAERVARAYMEAYSNVDFDAMGQLMAEDIVFEDPTSIPAGHSGIHREGREAVLQGFREFEQRDHPITLGLQWGIVYESNDRVIFMGQVQARFPSRQRNRDVIWASPQTSVVTVEDGRVVHHVDYADYDNARQGLVDSQ